MPRVVPSLRGALKAVEGKPSFNCATARRPVEKAICASVTLANLDREVHGSYVRALQEAPTPRDARAVKREQDAFIARRNAQFGRRAERLLEPRLVAVEVVDVGDLEPEVVEPVRGLPGEDDRVVLVLVPTLQEDSVGFPASLDEPHHLDVVSRRQFEVGDADFDVG